MQQLDQAEHWGMLSLKFLCMQTIPTSRQLHDVPRSFKEPGLQRQGICVGTFVACRRLNSGEYELAPAEGLDS